VTNQESQSGNDCLVARNSSPASRLGKRGRRCRTCLCIDHRQASFRRIIMNSANRTTVVGVFSDRHQAKRAFENLKNAGFDEDQIGVAARDKDVREDIVGHDTGTKVATGATVGVGAGAGVGVLWGLGIAAGMLPAIGPVIAGGTLAAILASAVGGAAVAGIAGALVGLGIPEEEAQEYEQHVHAGRVLITVSAGNRYEEAFRVIQSCGGIAQAQSVTVR
jgi:hypothetical protein